MAPRSTPVAVWHRRPDPAVAGLLSLDGALHLVSAAGSILLIRTLNDSASFLVDLEGGWCSCPDHTNHCGHVEAIRKAQDAPPGSREDQAGKQ